METSNKKLICQLCEKIFKDPVIVSCGVSDFKPNVLFWLLLANYRKQCSADLASNVRSQYFLSLVRVSKCISC